MTTTAGSASSSKSSRKRSCGSRSFGFSPVAPAVVPAFAAAALLALAILPPGAHSQPAASDQYSPVFPNRPPVDTGNTAGATLAQARQLLKQGQAAQAVPLLRQYTSMRPADPDGHFWLGLALDESGVPNQAIWAYSKSLDLGMREGMDSAELRIDIGNTLMKLNRPVDAIYNYRRAIDIEPKLPGAYFNLGRALIAKGEPEEALKQLSKAYELGLNDLMLPYFKALAYRALGKQEDARSQLELFVKTLPNAPNYNEVRAKAQELLKEPAPAVPPGAPPASKP